MNCTVLQYSSRLHANGQYDNQKQLLLVSIKITFCIVLSRMKNIMNKSKKNMVVFSFEKTPETWISTHINLLFIEILNLVQSKVWKN